MSPVAEALAVVAAQAFGAWGFTYLAHSTLLFAAAYVAVRFLKLTGDSEERVWRAALFGAPLTASARVALTLATGDPEPALAGALAARPAMAGIVALLWTVVVLTSATAVAWRLLRTLHRRPSLDDPSLTAEVAELAARLGLHRPVRVTRSADGGSPAAVGTREICLPDDARRRLAPDQMRAVLAHELAHHARRDPIWRLAADTCCAAFFFQPLNRVSRARLRDLGERGADALAIRVTGDPRALTEALARLAGGPDPRGALAAFAESPSRLIGRVERILWPEDPAARRALPRLAVPVMLLALAGFGPAVAASPEAAANHLSWLRPSAEPPGPRMLELRQTERTIQRRVREIERRPVGTVRRVFTAP